MSQLPVASAAVDDWPVKPAGRRGVLHTRVVTETGGGPDKTILLSAPFLADSPYWLAAAYMHPPDDPGFQTVRARAQKLNSPLIGVPDRGPLDGQVLRKMLEICRRYEIQIWHGHDYKSNLLGLLLRPLWPMKLVTTVHGWVKHTLKTPLYYAVDRWCLPYYHHVICVSQDLLDRTWSIGVPPDRCSLVHNAIDEKTFRRRFPPHESPLRAQMEVPPGRLVIGAVGRLSPEKAFNNLIHAAAKLIGEGLDLELWIVGQGDSREDLQKLIDHLKLSSRIKLLGFYSDMIALYHALDLFVLSSIREGLPNVVLEAMAMNVPVVSTNVAGVPNLIQNGHSGLICPVGDIGGLTEAMRRVLTDAALRDTLARNARAKIEAQYSFTQRMAKVRAIYDRVLGLTPTSAAPSNVPNDSLAPVSGRQAV